MERSLWYAPFKFRSPVFIASKTAHIRNLRRACGQPGSHSKLPGAIAILTSLWPDPGHTGQRFASSILRHAATGLCYAHNVAGRCRQLFQRWAQTQVGLRQPGCCGTNGETAAVGQNTFWLMSLHLKLPHQHDQFMHAKAWRFPVSGLPNSLSSAQELFHRSICPLFILYSLQHGEEI